MSWAAVACCWSSRVPGHTPEYGIHYDAVTALTLRKGSCWPYRFVKMRSSSLRPPKCVRSGGASGCSGAGVALNARTKLDTKSARVRRCFGSLSNYMSACYKRTAHALCLAIRLAAPDGSMQSWRLATVHRFHRLALQPQMASPCVQLAQGTSAGAPEQRHAAPVPCPKLAPPRATELRPCGDWPAARSTALPTLVKIRVHALKASLSVAGPSWSALEVSTCVLPAKP